MASLTFQDRCRLFILVFLTLGALTGGIVSIKTSGYSEVALLLISCGGVFLLIVIISAIQWFYHNHCRRSEEPTPIQPVPMEDLPPNYRLTWRKEFMEKSPEHLKAYLESSIGSRKSNLQFWHRTHPQILTAGLEAGIHYTYFNQAGPSYSESLVRQSAHFQSEFASSSSTSNDTSANPLDQDTSEGLPSYEEAENLRQQNEPIDPNVT